jgi:dTDP-4-dehydrorhamnose reductase
MKKTALIVGVSGIVGRNLADLLIAEKDWTVYGMARRPGEREGVVSVAVDLQDDAAVDAVLKDVKPTHIFLATWLRQPTEAENIRVNAGMVRNVLNAVSKAKTVEHVALVTGLKHYLGPFEAYGKGSCLRLRFAKNRSGWISRTFTTRKKTKSLPPLRAMATAGAFTVRIPSLVMPWAMR